jgi:hypothetical protein
MTQEDKELLLKELSARLPYGVKVTWDGKHPLTVTPYIYCAILKIDNLPKLLLRSMSSMTEEEREEYRHLVAFSGSPDGAANFIDWLNAHHFDYRGLIERELAIAVTEENNPYKE